MLVASCPHCGANIALNLAQPDVLPCGFCGQRGVPDQATRRGLQAAEEALRQQDAHRRQLSRAQRRSLESSRIGATVKTAVILAGVFVGLNLISTCGKVSEVRGAQRDIGWVMAIAGVLACTYLAHRAYTNLQRACVAVPPLGKGQRAGCRVCGAPVAAEGEKAIARCAYCHADNLVSKAALARATKRLGVVTRDLARSIEQQAIAAQMAARRPLVGMALLVTIGPALPLVTGYLLVRRAQNIPTVFAAYETDAGRCFVRVYQDWMGREYFGWFRLWDHLIPADDRERLTALDLVGRKVYGEAGAVGRVKELAAHKLVIETHGYQLELATVDTCFADKPYSRLLGRWTVSSELRRVDMALDGDHIVVRIDKDIYVLHRRRRGFKRLSVKETVNAMSADGGDIYLHAERGILKVGDYAGNEGDVETIDVSKPFKSSTTMGEGTIAVDDRYVYFSTTHQSIERVPKNSQNGEPESIVGNHATGRLALTRKKIYWVTAEGIYRATKSGDKVERVRPGPESVDELRSNGKRVWYRKDSAVFRASAKGTQLVGNAELFAVGGGKVMWSGEPNKPAPFRRVGVRTRALKGRSKAQALGGGVPSNFVVGIAIDDEGACWAERTDYSGRGYTLVVVCSPLTSAKKP